MKTLLLWLVLPFAAWADGGLPQQPYIYVEGRAELQKPADLVTLSFALAATDVSQSTANQQVQKQAGEVFKLLKDHQIADADVAASDLRSEAKYEEGDGPGRRGKFLGYEVTRPFIVKVHELKEFSKLVDELLALEVAQFDGIQEGLMNQTEISDQVWGKALDDATAKAKKTLAAAGLKIESIFAISPVPIPDIQTRILGGGTGATTYKSVVGPPDKVTVSEYRLSPVTVSESIHVIFLIGPAVK